MILQVTGEPGLIPWLSRGFYIYYPILIFVLCIATFFKLGTRIMSLLGYESFLGEDEFSIDFIDEGKTLMKRGECYNAFVNQWWQLDDVYNYFDGYLHFPELMYAVL